MLKKIVHVESYFDPSAGYQVNELLRVKTDGVRQVLFTSDDLSVFHKNLDHKEDQLFEVNYHVKIIRLEITFKYSSRVILKDLWSKLYKEQPDILFLHGIFDFRDLVLYKRKLNCVVVRDCHMSWVGSRNRFAVVGMRLFSLFFAPIINYTEKYKRVFALGEEELQYLIKLGINRQKISMLPHGYNNEVIYFDQVGRNNIRNDLLKLDKDAILVSYIGKFDANKRPDLIFDIIEEIDELFLKKNKLHFLFAGPQDTTYMDKIFNNKLNQFIRRDNVVVLQNIPFNELFKYYSATDICLWPRETTLSSIHAQVCGSVVIMENQLSNFERVIDKDNLFEIGNLKNASIILQRVIRDKKHIRKNNFRLGSLYFDREYSNHMTKIIGLFHE